ncbi:hypothetical protein Pla22_22690 [Rubripirellula amarantea]|uniref:Planctomycete cytochrome C n=1 Tax=Rubripirellula amarantea TaxID=2527999 RepID=A0A5C5WWM8_9BACT|nr:DUF1592 domain-containing protein [Rubripirellula amarantea]TWT54619.1 hypothetical protein Pla22_22690 [Rubripirellula amarantea]
MSTPFHSPFAILLPSLVLFLIGPSLCGANGDLNRSTLDPFLNQHCGDCHANGQSEGGFDLESLQNDLNKAATFAKWERVFDRVHDQEMPPEDVATVSPADRQLFDDTLSASLSKAHAANKGTVYRRLNRREYQNTMNDIFGTKLNLVDRLPEDGRSHEFDNVGDALGISMVHLQQYLEAADEVMNAAIEKTAERPPMQTVAASYADTMEGKRFIGNLWKKLPDDSVVFFARMGYPTGMLRGTEVKPPGRYTIRVTGYAYQSDKPITIRVGGTSFRRGSEKLTYGFTELAPGEPTTVELQADIEDRYMIEIDPWGIDTGSYNLRKDGIEGYRGPGAAIRKVELIGPILEEFPGRGHQLLLDQFVRSPIKTKKWQREQAFELQSDDPNASARKTLFRLANLAFRRPVLASDVERYVDLFQKQLDQGASLENALRTAVAAVFCSPDFLYFNEPDGWLDDHAIANRLAYFLTRSAPDGELRRSADKGELKTNPSALINQVRRLIDGEHNDRFVNDFCDAWLNLRDMDFTSPDQQLFPEYDQFLHQSMIDETRAFVSKLIRDNLPIGNLVQSDFAMLNERLARHYEIENVHGPEIRAVTLPKDSIRGGLLSQASVLKVSANGTNTSPVVRGVWVMERILGKPPQPPPPGIPGIEPDIRGATTLRELLDKHRDLDSCRSCHTMIDPPGFALECFDPIGGYRERFRSLGEGEKVQLEISGRKVRYKLGPAVDASGELPDGRSFDDYREFRAHLAADSDTIATSFVTKLLTFATGRDMGFSDRPEISKIVAQSKSKGYRVGDLIEHVVTSNVFRKK